MSENASRCDVAILGSGIAGSSLALVLARQGLRVRIFDQGVHPRFALGESTIPPSSHWMKVIAEKWDVPELHHISTAHSVNRRIMPSSGVKKNFGFVYHEEGAEQPRPIWQVPLVNDSSLTGESHLFRQDVDAYLYQSALKRGADGISRISIEDVEADEDGVKLRSSRGDRFEASFVVDASGYRSPLSSRFGLREQPTRLKTHSRAIFTHMVGVTPFDRIFSGPEPLTKWHSGTLHHMFDGGWIWVIPFDNHPLSQNRVCSVGLNLDARRFPKDPQKGPEQEWREFIDRFPSVARQFEGAVAVRDWVTTPRLQYSNSSTVGPRYWIAAHAGGTVDALYSRGLLNTFQGLHYACCTILSAFENNDFSCERFAPLDAMAQNLLDVQDGLVHGSYAALRDPSLLEAWLPIWWLSEVLSNLKVLVPLQRYSFSRDRADLNIEDDAPQNCMTEYAAFAELLDASTSLMQRFESGEVDSTQAQGSLESMLDGLLEQGFDHRQTRDFFGKFCFSGSGKSLIKWGWTAKEVAGRLRPGRGGLRSLGIGHYDFNRFTQAIEGGIVRMAYLGEKLQSRP